MQPLLQGLLSGLIISVLPGPVLFLIIRNTLNSGYKVGFATVFGMWISDLLMLIILFLFLNEVSEFFSSTTTGDELGIFGGLLIAVFGLGILLNKSKAHGIVIDESLSNKRTFKFIMQGFSINTVNPSAAVFWSIMVSNAYAAETWGNAEYITYALSILCVIMLTDSLKVYFANHIRTKLNSSYISKINKITGALILAIGIYLVVKYLNL